MRVPKRNIVWLASYPKSGNTWIRIFLANYLSDKNEPIDINKIDSSIISSARGVFDTHSAVLASDLTPDEIDIIRPKVYRELAKEEQITYIKTHDANHKNIKGEPLFVEEITLGVIHIVRNPLDVAVSYAHHFHKTIEETISILNNSANVLSPNIKSLNKQLRQKLFSWSEHYESWAKTKSPYLLVKYEDLKKDTYQTSEKILLFVYGEINEDRLKRAIEFSDFSNLQHQEKETGFKEKPTKAEHFFRKGIIGSWKEEMTKKQTQQIIKDHKKVMTDLNYL